MAATKRTKRTLKKTWPQKFLERLRQTGNVGVSAKAAGIARSQVYHWRGTHPDFAAGWDEALEDAVDALEAEARSRAIEGESDVLLMFLLKAHRPAKYRERVQAEHTGGVTVRVIYDGDPDPAPPAAPGAGAGIITG
jgi:hypothetical protein